MSLSKQEQEEYDAGFADGQSFGEVMDIKTIRRFQYELNSAGDDIWRYHGSDSTQPLGGDDAYLTVIARLASHTPRNESISYEEIREFWEEIINIPHISEVTRCYGVGFIKGVAQSTQKPENTLEVM